ncbi:group II intron reverse transcriptase/maturase [Paenibacillus polymyxa]|uniref:group II intron reverse transcriptase/maturase n=1 Tax=Paenibacillus polymyxa TaxID=1406 RepID=UPI001BEBD754|nr:group II intron reverse transcriptase/maturase [Paenibacillus polymyxa]MBT2286007.1 group II intron reverse transcriptase/maturase [Paenibacillus polymyxa]
MARELKHPQDEQELKATLDLMYRITKDESESENGRITGFKNLVEVIGSEANIVTAIHKLKGNPGSKTPGVDDITIREILESHYDEVIDYVRKNLQNYHPKPVRRKWIPKPGKEEKRPLGIPTIGDRIIQECVRNVIDPIMEAQFYKHSYGSRPMRDAHQALSQLTDILWKTGHTWVVEGEISKFFDTINHSILLKKLWNMGVRDKRVLMLIKQMLKAGVMEETKTNELGTPQGGIISPLLANVYLHSFDKWVAREWEEKRTKQNYSRQDARYRALRTSTNLKPAYFIRYADDWVLVTNSRINAEKWKHRIARYLNNNLKLDLSHEKTLVTNVSKRAMKFLGYELKVRPGKAKKGWISQTRPNRERLQTKVREIRKDIKNLRRQKTKELLIDKIARINSKIRGLAEYYKRATLVNVDLGRYKSTLWTTTKRSLWGRKKNRKVIRIPADQTDNLRSVHENYKARIWAVEHEGMKFGLTSIGFIKWQPGKFKDHKETPYTKEGRKMHRERTIKIPLKVRADKLLTEHQIRYTLLGKEYNPIYNFEYIMNRAYAYNRDKGKCKVCKTNAFGDNVNIHHNCPKLPIKDTNKVPNLSTLCVKCHRKIHDGKDYSYEGKKIWEAIRKFREMLPIKNSSELSQLRKTRKEKKAEELMSAITI